MYNEVSPNTDQTGHIKKPTGTNSAEPAVLKFHPSFFPLLCENFEDFFEIQEFMENGNKELFLVLSILGGKLLITSNKVTKRINQLYQG